MKSEISPTKKPRFRPYTLKIEIETMDDLVFLWCVFNACEDRLRNTAYDHLEKLETALNNGADTMAIWRLLDDLMQKQ